MTRHRAARPRSRRLAGLLVAAAGTVAALALPFLWSAGPERHPVRPRAEAVAAAAPRVRPAGRAHPKYLARSYRAPPALVRRGAGGRLRIPSLGVDAPVDAVQLDGTAMAVPDEPSRVGWLSSTAGDADPLGASLLAGHVSDRDDHPGALFGLRRIRPHALILWSEAGGGAHRYRVLRVQVFARSGGLPAELFETDGPHRLVLVTCAERVSTAGGGFHYRSNLVVTAVEVTHRTGRGSTG